MSNTLRGMNELEDGSYFDNVPLVLGLYLGASRDLPKYCIKGRCVAWHNRVTDIFKDAGLTHVKSTYTVHERLAAFGMHPYGFCLPP
jgi:hypothetical protein